LFLFCAGEPWCKASECVRQINIWSSAKRQSKYSESGGEVDVGVMPGRKSARIVGVGPGAIRRRPHSQHLYHDAYQQGRGAPPPAWEWDGGHTSSVKGTAVRGGGTVAAWTRRARADAGDELRRRCVPATA